jgi:large subunit ribosomal protein L18
MDKKTRRLQRARRGRAKMLELGVYRLCVYRSPRHIYAQLLSPTGGEVLTSASTLESELKKDLKYTGNIEAAIIVGKRIADRAKEKGITEVAFDRSGFKYHGRVKALAEAARESGLKF